MSEEEGKQAGVMVQRAPWPTELERAVEELHYMEGWKIWISEEDRGQGCSGLTLSIVPNNRDSYHPEKHANTVFTYAVPAAAYNRESWEEWIWSCIEETEGHERAEAFKFVTEEPNQIGIETFGTKVIERRPFKPAHPDGWDPGVVRSVVSESVVNTPNAGRLVQFPCNSCGHNHYGKMGEHFTIQEDKGCVEEDCTSGLCIKGRA